jgi:hypothetical protein
MNQQGALEVVAGMLLCIGIILVIYLVVYILFLLNLHRTLAEVAERNRELSPGLVWLSLIPLFNIVWNIIMVAKIANSLKNEFSDRGWSTQNEGFARTTGMIWAWGGVASVVLSIIQNGAQFADARPIAMVLGLLSCPLSLAIFICWIMFWVQTHGYKVRLREGERGYGSGSPEEDYDDNYRRPRHEDRDDRDDDLPRRRDDY